MKSTMKIKTILLSIESALDQGNCSDTAVSVFHIFLMVIHVTHVNTCYQGIHVINA